MVVGNKGGQAKECLGARIALLREWNFRLADPKPPKMYVGYSLAKTPARLDPSSTSLGILYQPPRRFSHRNIRANVILSVIRTSLHRCLLDRSGLALFFRTHHPMSFERGEVDWHLAIRSEEAKDIARNYVSLAC